jgi:hypothetical protein
MTDAWFYLLSETAVMTVHLKVKALDAAALDDMVAHIVQRLAEEHDCLPAVALLTTSRLPTGDGGSPEDAAREALEAHAAGAAPPNLVRTWGFVATPTGVVGEA